MERAPAEVTGLLAESIHLEDSPAAFAGYDWSLHHTLTVASGNPVYTLILNGFAGFYEQLARLYFSRSEARDSSRAFYSGLLAAASQGDAAEAERITSRVMLESLALWRQTSG